MMDCHGKERVYTPYVTRNVSDSSFIKRKRCDATRTRPVKFLFLFFFLMVVSWILLSHFAQAQGSGSPHLFGRDDTCPEHRSIADIFWSCLATTFLCTWVTVHPNVPPQGEPLLVSTLRRLHIMIWALLCPEIVLAWAARQWIAAKKIHEAFERRVSSRVMIGGSHVDRQGLDDGACLLPCDGRLHPPSRR